MSENETRSPYRTTRRVATAALIGAVLVTLGSCSYRTRWESAEIRGGQVRSTGTTTDGIGQWAFLTFPLGSLAIGLLLVARLLTSQGRIAAHQGRRISVALILLAAASLATASAYAYSYWRPLLAERAAGALVANTETGTTTMELSYIAWGLPIVAVAGALGGIVCIAFAVLLIRTNGRTDGQHLSAVHDLPLTDNPA